MKYVQRNTNIEAFFLNMGENTFNPLLLNQQNLKFFLNELLIAEQTKMNTVKKLNGESGSKPVLAIRCDTDMDVFEFRDDLCHD